VFPTGKEPGTKKPSRATASQPKRRVEEAGGDSRLAAGSSTPAAYQTARQAGLAKSERRAGAGNCGAPLKSRRPKKATGSWRLSFVALCGLVADLALAPPIHYPKAMQSISTLRAGPATVGLLRLARVEEGRGNPDTRSSVSVILHFQISTGSRGYCTEVSDTCPSTSGALSASQASSDD
jgi:hypothetical protein